MYVCVREREYVYTLTHTYIMHNFYLDNTITKRLLHFLFSYIKWSIIVKLCLTMKNYFKINDNRFWCMFNASFSLPFYLNFNIAIIPGTVFLDYSCSMLLRHGPIHSHLLVLLCTVK